MGSYDIGKFCGLLVTANLDSIASGDVMVSVTFVISSEDVIGIADDVVTKSGTVVSLLLTAVFVVAKF